MTESINNSERGFEPYEDLIKCFNIYAKSVHDAELARYINPDNPSAGVETPNTAMTPIRMIRESESPLWAGGDYGAEVTLKFRPIGPLMPYDLEPSTKNLYDIQVGATRRWQEVNLLLTLELITSGNFLPIKAGATKKLTYSPTMKSPLSSSIQTPLTMGVTNTAGDLLPVMELVEIGPNGGFEEGTSSGHDGVVGGLPNQRGRLFQEFTIKLLIRINKPDTMN
jgi:hypothetical protein